MRALLIAAGLLAFTFTTLADNQTTEAHVSWGNDTLTITNALNEAYSIAEGRYEINTNDLYFVFEGTAVSRLTYRRAEVHLTSIKLAGPFNDTQTCFASATVVDELTVPGLASTGSIRYVVFFTRERYDQSAYQADVEWNYHLTHNGVALEDADNVSITPMGSPDTGFYALLIKGSFPVAAGESFEAVLSLDATLDAQLASHVRFADLTFELLDVEVEGPEGSYPVISKYGHLAPRTSPLSIQSHDEQLSVNWYSLTNRLYQPQRSTAPDENVWVDIGSPQQGTGTKNEITLTNPAPHETIRVIEHF